MEKERQVIDKLLSKGTLRIKDAWVLKKNSRRMGMQVGLKEALLLLRALAKTVSRKTHYPITPTCYHHEPLSWRRNRSSIFLWYRLQL